MNIYVKEQITALFVAEVGTIPISLMANLSVATVKRKQIRNAKAVAVLLQVLQLMVIVKTVFVKTVARL